MRMRHQLSTRETSLIDRYLGFYRDLDSGSRKPTTPDQRRFISVCRGDIRPTSEHEIAYMKYRANRKINARSCECSRREESKRESPRHRSTGDAGSVTPNPNREKWVSDQSTIAAIRKQIEAEQRAKERDDEKRRAIQTEARRANGPEQPSKPRKGEISPMESRSDDIPEFEEGYPNSSWYPGRDNSSMDPYGRNRYQQ